MGLLVEAANIPGVERWQNVNIEHKIAPLKLVNVVFDIKISMSSEGCDDGGCFVSFPHCNPTVEMTHGTTASFRSPAKCPEVPFATWLPDR